MTPVKALVSLLTVAAAASLSGCDIGEASAPDQAAINDAPPVPVETSHPYRSDVYATYETTAAITSDADAPVVARAAGELVELLVEEGDRVSAGQVLAKLDGERLRLEMLVAKANLAKARREYTRNKRLHERGLISASMFEGLKFELAALEATYELKQLNYDYSNIRAPIDGVVSERTIKPGQNVNIGDVAFRITDTTELLADLRIPQAQLSKFQPGQAATIRVASMPDNEFDASIIRISPTIDAQSGTFRATVRVRNKDGALAPGMFGRFSIAYEQHPDALVVPAAALLDDDEQSVVYVVTDDKVVRRAVETGIRTNGQIEILDGLAENEQIVVVGQGGLRDGSKILASSTPPDSFSG